VLAGAGQPFPLSLPQLPLTMRNQPSPEEKAKAFEAFRSDVNKVVDKGMEEHESKMTKMGFLFLGIFVGVIALAALLP
jgi:hypothetical protein